MFIWTQKGKGIVWPIFWLITFELRKSYSYTFILTFYLKRRSVHYEILKEEQKCHILFWTFCHSVFLNSDGVTPEKSNVVDEVVLSCSKRSCSFFFFLEAKREHIHVTKSKLAPLQRRSVLDDLVLSLKSLKSSCEFHIPRERIRRWAEFKRRMINLWMTFWSIISELTKTVLLSLKGKHLKNVFFLNDELQMSNFVSALFFHTLLKSKENMFGLVRQHVLTLKSFFSFHSTFVKQDWDVDLNLRADVIFFAWYFGWLYLT